MLSIIPHVFYMRTLLENCELGLLHVNKYWIKTDGITANLLVVVNQRNCS